jgi:hypothetical protein
MYGMQVLITLKLCKQHFVIFCIDTRTPYPSSGDGSKKTFAGCGKKWKFLFLKQINIPTKLE